MSNGSNPHSIAPSKPLDPATIRVLRAVDHAASALNCPFFVAGATARDLMLVNVYGLRPGRATRDIDFGIAVKSWDEFQGLKERMIATVSLPETRRRSNAWSIPIGPPDSRFQSISFRSGVLPLPTR
jgi:predicted nucleotidyltransferase